MEFDEETRLLILQGTARSDLLKIKGLTDEQRQKGIERIEKATTPGEAFTVCMQIFNYLSDEKENTEKRGLENEEAPPAGGGTEPDNKKSV